MTGQGVPASIDDARRAMYRAQVLAGAEREFARTGFAGAKMTAIAAAADLSLATVYKHFAGKDEIWDALHAERMDALLAHVAETRVAGASALERLLAGVAGVFRYMSTQDGYLDLSLWATGWPHTSGHGVQQTVWSAGVETLVEGVRSANAAGETIALDPTIGAGVIVASLQVWLARWVAEGRPQPVEDYVVDFTQRLRWLLAGPTATS